MTKRERAARAAAWRRVARRAERWRGRMEVYLCCEADDIGDGEGGRALWDYFRPTEDGRDRPTVWWSGTACGSYAEADDCRVIAAGLIAAMYETGEFDD